MLVLDFKVDYRLKNTQKYFCEMHGKSYKDAKKKGYFSVNQVRNNQILTSAKLININ